MCQSFVQELKNYPTYKQYELDAKYNGNRNIVLQSAAQIFGVSEWEGGGGGGRKLNIHLQVGYKGTGTLLS